MGLESTKFTNFYLIKEAGTTTNPTRQMELAEHDSALVHHALRQNPALAPDVLAKLDEKTLPTPVTALQSSVRDSVDRNK